jgi:hypothetical protein
MREVLESAISFGRSLFGHEKAPQDSLRRLVKMERAKRLERDGQNSQDAAAPNTCASVESPGALGDAHEDNSSERIAPARDPTGQAAHDGDASLQELIARWSALNPTLKAAILAIARVPDPHPPRRSPTVRPDNVPKPPRFGRCAESISLKPGGDGPTSVGANPTRLSSLPVFSWPRHCLWPSGSFFSADPPLKTRPCERSVPQIPS